MLSQLQTATLASALFLAAAASAQFAQTGITGSGAPFSNVQPSLAIHYFMQQPFATFGIGVPIRMFAYDYNPTGNWVSCDGRSLLIRDYQLLFAQLGTQFGGDGRTNFTIPDLRGRTPIGPMPDVYFVGQPVGDINVNINTSNLPSHSHQTPVGPCGQTGSDVPFYNLQPSLVLKWSIATGGIFPPRQGGFAVGPADPYIGQVILHAAFPTHTNNFSPADGASLLIADNQPLFSILGTYYGGDGRTEFSLPDLQRSAAIGVGQGQGLTLRELAEVLGTESQTISPDAMATHRHSLPNSTFTQPSGAGQPLNTVQPSLGLTYCIAIDGIFPGNSMNDQLGYIGEIIIFAGNFVPGAYLPCDGRLLVPADYEALFVLIGTTYGGDGVNTFALPDLRGRIPVAANSANPIGAVFGAEAITLTTANLAAHAHSVPCPADFNHDFVMDFFDYLDFVSAFANFSTTSDFNRDGVTDFFDYLDFVQAFSTGCN